MTIPSGAFNFFEAGVHKALTEAGAELSFQAGSTIVKPGQYIRAIPLLLKGIIRVSRINEEGDELFLYYIEAGQSCAASLSSCLLHKIGNINAIAETDIELVAVPAEFVTRWFEQFSSWRLFILKTMDYRYNEIVHTLDNIAFKNIDQRLIDYLLSKSNAIGSNNIITTHQQIATELCTSREVISRLLKTLELDKKIKLSRNKIELISLL